MKFTVWGKVGDLPVQVTYDNGKLMSDPPFVADRVQAFVNLVKTGRWPVLQLGRKVYTADVIDTPLGYKAAITYALTSVDRWEGEVPMERVPRIVQALKKRGMLNEIDF